jgi:hypothetical protein
MSANRVLAALISPNPGSVLSTGTNFTENSGIKKPAKEEM